MKQSDKEIISILIENNASQLISMCSAITKVSDTALEQLLQADIFENVRIIQKLKGMK